MFRLSRVLCSYFSPPYKSFKETLIFFLLPWHVYCCSSLMEEEPSGQGFENNPCSHVHDPSSPLSRFPFSIVSLSLFSPYSLILCFLHRVQFSSVAQSGLTLCDPMDGSMPGFSVLHHLLEFAQTHIHWVGGATLYISYFIFWEKSTSIYGDRKRLWNIWLVTNHLAKQLDFW